MSQLIILTRTEFWLEVFEYISLLILGLCSLKFLQIFDFEVKVESCEMQNAAIRVCEQPGGCEKKSSGLHKLMLHFFRLYASRASSPTGTVLTVDLPPNLIDTNSQVFQPRQIRETGYLLMHIIANQTGCKTHNTLIIFMRLKQCPIVPCIHEELP